MISIPRTLAVLQQGLAEGLHIGVQLCALLDGTLVVDLALGSRRLAADDPGRQDIPMAADTLMLWLSAGKPLTAAAVCMLWDQRVLQLDDPVARFIPQFAQNGKDEITIRHLLTHTAGIRGTDPSYPFVSWDETLAHICAMPMERNWVPGLRAGYHTLTSWYVLGELINRVTGTPHDLWIREHLLLPLGMADCWLAMDGGRYESYGPRLGYLYDTTTSPPAPLKNYDTPLAAARPRPAASCRGPVRELANFYEMLRLGGSFRGTTLLQPQTVAAMTMRQRLGMYDQTFRHIIDWGLGLIINSAHRGGAIPYQFGPHASADTFGHGGSQSSTGFCDPARKLVVALLFNGCPGEPAHDRRLRATLAALYEDLRLAGRAG